MIKEIKNNIQSKDSTSYKIAYAISRIFDTPIMTLLIFFVFLFKVDVALSWLLLLIIGNLLPSISFLIYGYRTKRISDLDVTDRRERELWYTIMAISWIITLIVILLIDLNIPYLMIVFQVWLTVFGLFNAIITYFWKISSHAMLSTSLSMWLAFLWNPWFWGLLFTFVPIICWARYRTKKHTIAQLFVGFILMFSINMIIWFTLIYQNQ